MAQSETVTFLFTDLTQSTEHLQRAGDETGQRLFGTHHKQMTQAVMANGGEELEWLGDGILAAFSSAGDAVRCGISVQQTARRPSAQTRFDIRVGIHAGEALRRDGGYFGTPVVTARRLCDRAEPGQILCSRVITQLLAGRTAFSFRDLGEMALKGLGAPVAVSEVVYERNDAAALLNRTPFVGRSGPLERLSAQLEAASNGHGMIAMLLGEPGVGKSRLLEEFADLARQRDATVLRGACYDGEWQPPYGPFAEIILEFARKAESAELKLFGGSGPTLARIAPGLRTHLGDIPEPVALDKDEERFRLFDAVAQLLIEISARHPLVLMLDDLHWADRGTVAMLAHVAHFVPRNQMLLIGAYRDAEVDRKHPMTGAMAAIRRLPGFESLALKGLSGEEVAGLLEIIGDQLPPTGMVKTLTAETGGNPLFIREVLLHLREEGKILTDGSAWGSHAALAEADIPEGVREIIKQRLLRLSKEANRMLTVGAAFNGAFSFEVAAAVAELDEQTALAALDEALEAKLLRPGANPDSFDFTHAMIRHTLYSELNPARRTRQHRRIAEQMERAWGEHAAEHAAEVAYQFWRGASESGAGRGADYALAAADNAESAYAHDEVASFLRIALEMLPATDPRRPRLMARLGLALVLTSSEDEEAPKVAREAGELIAASESPEAAAEYLARAARAMFTAAGLQRGAWELAAAGLRYAADRKDAVWASLQELDLTRQSAEDPENVGIRTDSPKEQEFRNLLRVVPVDQLKIYGVEPPISSRLDILQSKSPTPIALLTQAGQIRESLEIWRNEAAQAEQRGRVSWAMVSWANVARCYFALGEFTPGQAALDRATALATRSVVTSVWYLSLLTAQQDRRMALDEGWEETLQDPRVISLMQQPRVELHFVSAAIRASGAYLMSRINQPDLAMPRVISVVPALEHGAGWTVVYGSMACDIAAALWFLNRTDSIEIVERNLREKVLVPDFRPLMRDSRLSMARLCALQGRYNEAGEWFAKARTVLDEQGARPLRAIVDFDEALMHQRHGTDLALAQPLFEAALEQFRKLEMSGWVKAAEKVVNNLSLNPSN
jgi:class 3 adenylate cyclase/tetratricopeptide (TPR) repeat protein